mmetsp:Transcript_49133/g.57392  ORF Transcript_49133/g.57392 Transcript_49133/m.57392 type:complete len:341 (+) Transcript_49133:55-1077(+)|eukprot:CAMPEP_0194407358 /NCGR_PEP_ID=MMETSP0176-20130528/5388_1 /TAXON_ID=216777 /ORGANISM="Proboscia alata, Strain PI-D3" /LENGTH=340 /DNA_ID=CAMNT_0039206943 /DNA_START=20 /DNA_END=1042 /DNA_ORIENTATION=-
MTIRPLLLILPLFLEIEGNQHHKHHHAFVNSSCKKQNRIPVSHSRSSSFDDYTSSSKVLNNFQLQQQPSHSSSDTTQEEQQGANSRRSFNNAVVSGAISYMSAGLLQNGLQPIAAAAAATADENNIDVYFGCGCFWHVQHEFVEAEKKILGRTSAASMTSRAGYAGGLAGADGGKVCYHNALNVADYGKLGHAEVVKVSIPPSSFPQFAQEYFKLFDDKGFRPDQFGDKGPEYRNLVGIPGGAKGEYGQQLVDASTSIGDKLDFAIGKGDDKDLAKVAFVMDTTRFPFYVAENYHQFHDGFNFGENYPAKYNKIAQELSKNGENFGSCPNGMVGIGIGGL